MGVTATAKARTRPDATKLDRGSSVEGRRGGTRTLQRVFDVFAATVLLVAASPVLLGGMLAVWLGSGRPLLFGHVRLGRGGRRFRCWKLRTMRVDAERALDDTHHLKRLYVRNGYKLPLSSDPRVTRVGRVLRRTYVDELPQLFNVLGGAMSLIGPRPIVPDELENYGSGRADLLRERPGLIGAWTSRGLARPPYPERAWIELDYVRSRSIGRDIAILLHALPVVLRGQPEDA